MKKLFLVFLLISQIFSNATPLPDLTLFWEKNPENDVVKYIVSIGEKTKVYTTKVDVIDNMYTIVDPTPRKYYITITAVNKAGLESDPSQEVLFEILNSVADPLNKGRYINVQMSTDGGKTYKSIGMVPYPEIKGQKYKTTIFIKK